MSEARRDVLASAQLYVVSDARTQRKDLEPFLDAILGASVRIVQLRDKNAEAGELLRWSEVFRRAADRHGALFVLNDRPDVALAAGADGVHLGQNDLPAAWARRIVGSDMIIGLSTHTAEEFHGAPPEADYMCVGPVHATATKPGRPATGLDIVRDAAQSDETRPWFAIGGLEARNIAEVATAGARRVAVVRAVTQAADAARAVRDLLAALAES